MDFLTKSVFNPEMSPAKLNAITDEGVEPELLAPFFEALLPAFEDGAEEIRVEPIDSGLKITYAGHGSSVPLPSSPRNYAWVAFPRILILSGLSISLKEVEQSGQLRVRFNQQLMTIQVVSWRDSDRWFLVFRSNTGPKRSAAPQ
jgi:type II secretory ATPase GspE/PulE/Tfp pilus assembly ATPase PilB-like protein